MTFLPYYCCLLNQSVPVLLALFGVFGNKHGSWTQSLALLCVDSCLTVLCASSCLGICHTENIISLYASIEATVAWDGSTELLSLIGGTFDSVEHAKSILVCLLLLATLLIGVSEVHSLGLWCLLSSTFVSIDSEEFVHCWGRNRLWPLRIIKGLLPSYRYLPLCALRRFGQWSRTSCHCAWRIRRWRMTCTWCWLAGRCLSRWPVQLIGNWFFHRSIHKRFHS